MSSLTIAIDGPGSSGKGTIAKLVARELGFQYIDTGAMYRSVALMAKRRGVAWDDAEALGALTRGLSFTFAFSGEQLTVHVDGEDVSGLIRTPEMGQGASDVSKHGPVRESLVAVQRGLGEMGGVVMDGRDIGTVVLPGAELKVFLDAALDERARRRHRELLDKGEDASYDAIRDALAARDHQDRTRAIAPLVPADDAVILDSTDLTIEGAAAVVLELARSRAPQAV
ncbi:MAG: (d)CMP kinase [Deltaproteobacteria bacterium]|nr:MAG: (d)CMP kinase [Deltaproteobacteria bacterium]